MHSPSMSMSRAAPPSPTLRVLAITFALVAVVGLGFATVSKKWLYNPRTVNYGQEVSFGPRGVVMCEIGEDCKEMSNAALIEDWEEQLEHIKTRAHMEPGNEILQKAVEVAAVQLRTNSGFPIFGWIA